MKCLTSTYLNDIEKYKLSFFLEEKYCITVKNYKSKKTIYIKRRKYRYDEMIIVKDQKYLNF